MTSAATSRHFTLQDQLAFAALSGDRNPIHVDPVQARRLLFGAPVVHGMHLVLWSLDRLSTAGHRPEALSRVEAKFDSAILVDEKVTMEPADIGTGAVGVRLRSARRGAVRLRFAFDAAPASWRNPGPPAPEPCRELGSAAIAAAAGSVPLGYDAAGFAALFPALGGLAARQAAWLLASTRIVGMRVPGLHSIFTGLQASFDPATTVAGLDYRTLDWDDRFQLATIALSGGGEGQATALLRPAPVGQRRFADIAAQVASGRFAGASALIVGGSRGLGEAGAKLLAAGGARVTLTYRDGRQDAERVAAEINEAGGRAATMRLDVTAPDRVPAMDGAPFTHLLFCAAPRIRKGSADFDSGLSATYAEVFVRGLEQLLAAAEPHLAGEVTLLVPSTVYIDRPEAGFTEYAAAKSAGEAAAERAAERIRTGGRKVRLLQPRFGRLRTDQTAQVGGSDGADAADALLAVL
ncbi:SDR family NAD(P)-dependent oxidoreductase [Desertibaculum subflavum]|uniref:SDR family NAD(P)-dependent oxidoreductase n=1 Tax=Desertibaculum subflavum TaxID=2268458 RepID=UPI000E66FE38